MNPEFISLGELLAGFDHRIRKDSVDKLKRGFDRFRTYVKGKPFVVITLRESIDIDASPTDTLRIEKAVAREEDAAALAQEIHDEICKAIVSEPARKLKL